MVRVPIPLIPSQKTSDSFVRNTLEKLKNLTVSKPGRKLGGVWTDDKVGQRQAITMCPDCVRKYKNWWKPVHYKPDWGWRYFGDCDGCGINNLHVTLFLQEAEFYKSLSHNHGRRPQPGGF
jgi:hypothetical protein